MYCRNCGDKIDNSVAVCPSCGARTDGKKKGSKWWIWLILGVLAAVILVVVLNVPESKPEWEPLPTGVVDAPILTEEAEEPLVQVDAPEPEAETPRQSSLDVAIAEAIVYDQDGVTISVKGIQEGYNGKEIKMLVENATEQDLSVTCSEFVVNGITINGFFYADVAAGKKVNEVIQLYTGAMEEAGITDIATLTTHGAKIFDSETYNDIANISFSIETSIADSYVQEIDRSGEEMYSENGITAIYKNVTEDTFGIAIRVLVINETDKDIVVQSDDVSVNDFIMNAMIYDTVCAGTARFCNIFIYDSTLEDNEIETVEDITFALKFIDPESYSVIAKTDPVQLTAE